MIGVRAFLSDLAFPLVSGILFLLVLVAMIRACEPKVRTRGAVAIIILFLLSSVGIFRLIMQCQYRSELHNLNVNSLESIQIGEKKFADAKEIEPLLSSLQHAQWFTSEHGGWAQPVDLVIRFKSGKELRYRVARYLKQEGAVIDFIKQNASSDFVSHYGYAFANELPRILDQLGAALPAERNGS